MHLSAVQCIVMLCSKVQSIADQCSAVQFNALKFSLVLYSGVLYSDMCQSIVQRWPIYSGLFPHTAAADFELSVV